MKIGYILSLLLFSFSALAQDSTPTTKPPNQEAICSKVRAQDEANRNNPVYAQSEVGTLCAQIYASKKTMKMEKELGKRRAIGVGICSTAAGLCMVPTIGAKLGKGMAKMCGSMGSVLGIMERKAEFDLEKDLTKDTKAFDFVSTASDAMGLKDDIGMMGDTFEDGKNPTDTFDEKTGERTATARQNKLANCSTIGKEALVQSAEMATRFQTSNMMGKALDEQKKQLDFLLKQGGSFNQEQYQAEQDLDSFTPEEEPEVLIPDFPPEIEGPFEALTGLDLGDLTHGDMSPEAITAAIANAGGANPAEIAAVLAAAGGANAVEKAAPETDGGKNSMVSSSEMITIPTIDDLLKKMGEGDREIANVNKKIGKEIDKMTPIEFEKDTKHSIFARISLRYEKQKKDIETLLWTTKANQSANPKPINTLSTRYPASKP